MRPTEAQHKEKPTAVSKPPEKKKPHMWEFKTRDSATVNQDELY